MHVYWIINRAGLIQAITEKGMHRFECVLLLMVHLMLQEL